MSLETTEVIPNGLIDVNIKAEPLEEVSKKINSNLDDENDVEETLFFTELEVDNTRKCLENTRLIIKDFETQLDWHLQQYLTIKNMLNPQSGENSNDKKSNVLNTENLTDMIMNQPGGNRNFFKRKKTNGNATVKKRRKQNCESSENSNDSGSESELCDDSEDVDNPKPVKKYKRKYTKKATVAQVKEEIVEEVHELLIPKEECISEDEQEIDDNDDDDDYVPTMSQSLSASKRATSKTAAPTRSKGIEKQNNIEIQ